VVALLPQIVAPVSASVEVANGLRLFKDKEKGSGLERPDKAGLVQWEESPPAASCRITQRVAASCLEEDALPN